MGTWVRVIYFGVNGTEAPRDPTSNGTVELWEFVSPECCSVKKHSTRKTLRPEFPDQLLESYPVYTVEVVHPRGKAFEVLIDPLDNEKIEAMLNPPDHMKRIAESLDYIMSVQHAQEDFESQGKRQKLNE